jgi:hypothetical protein
MGSSLNFLRGFLWNKLKEIFSATEIIIEIRDKQFLVPGLPSFPEQLVSVIS